MSDVLTWDPGKLRDLAVKRKASSRLYGLMMLEVDLWDSG